MLTIALFISAIAVCCAARPAELVSAAPQDGAGGTKIALSKRTTLTAGGGVVNVTALHQHRAFRNAKIQNAITAYQSNTGKIHSLAKDVNQKRGASGPLALQDDSGEMWQGEITIGTPPQHFTVDFDTGSSDLVVANPWCKVDCDRRNVYHAEKSTTSKTLFAPFHLTYADGSKVLGLQYNETVSIANMTAPNQTIGSAFIYSEGFSPGQSPPDGLMGMAFPSISAFHSTPLLHNLASQGQLNDSVFAFKLSQNGSELFIGGVNDALYKGNFTYVNVTEQGFWQVNVDTVNVNGAVALGTAPAVIDTGTTLVIGESTAVQALYTAIPGAKPYSGNEGMYTIPCDNVPHVGLSFGGREFTMSPDVFNMGRVANSTEDCLGGIVGQDGQKFWIVGDIFLQNVYSAFDIGQSRVGFADLA